VNFWWQRTPPWWSVALAPLEWTWRAGAAIDRALTQPARARVPVISVGNLTVGGAGKTPVALAIAQRLQSRGRKPAILSRGYGREARHPIEVTPASDVREAGDEPLLFARAGVPAFVGPRRAQLAERAVASGADVLILDDGLQHHALARDLEVVVVDASNPFGNDRLLPRGPLRERVGALSRVQRGLLWLTRCDLARDDRLARLPAWPRVESDYATSLDLRGQRVFLFAGIARPESFAASVRALGAEIAGTRWFRDHHLYTQYEISSLRQAAGAARLLTTEKDLVRIDERERASISALPITVRIRSGEDALEAALGALG
jgi:tetraacyldisaccharide 4'-kinase